MADTDQSLGALRHAMTAAQAAPAAAAATPDTATEAAKPKIDPQGRAYATGKRKNAIARVWIKPGNGKLTVNGREGETYFARPVLRMIIGQPFLIVVRLGQYDVVATVTCGRLAG